MSDSAASKLHEDAERLAHWLSLRQLTPEEAEDGVNTILALVVEAGRYKDALEAIVEFEHDDSHSAGWHFAEVRRIAREVLR